MRMRCFILRLSADVQGDRLEDPSILRMAYATAEEARSAWEWSYRGGDSHGNQATAEAIEREFDPLEDKEDDGTILLPDPRSGRPAWYSYSDRLQTEMQAEIRGRFPRGGSRGTGRH